MRLRKKVALLLLLASASGAVQKKRKGVRPLFMTRHAGEFRSLVQELMLEDEEFFRVYMRMTPASFHVLLDLVAEDLKRQDTNFRTAISPGERLALTLRFLGHGDSMRMLSLTYRIGHSTVCQVIHDTTQVLWQRLQPLYMPTSTEEMLQERAEEFGRRWQYKNAWGAIDGKHVRLQCPDNSGWPGIHPSTIGLLITAKYVRRANL